MGSSENTLEIEYTLDIVKHCLVRARLHDTAKAPVPSTAPDGAVSQWTPNLLTKGAVDGVAAMSCKCSHTNQ